MQSVPAGTFVEVGVARDPLDNNCLPLVRYLGTVSPPFSAVPVLPPFVRQSIASLTPAQIASLRHGFQVMMGRSASDPTSYRFQANIHGTLDTPTTTAQMESWNRCEHASFYFLSWHRMYLYFFDRILRAASGDPNLALPYWNWIDPAQRTLPVAFRQPADSSNPLFIAPLPPGGQTR
jgi:tyrosinase